MPEHISYIACRFGNINQDSITVGVIYIDETDKVRIWVSQKRMKVLKSILKNSVFILFKGFVDGMTEFIEEGKGSFAIIAHESYQQNGLVHIIKPTRITTCPDKENSFAKKIFEKYIDNNFKE